MALAIRYAEAGVEGLLRDKTRPPGTAKLATATVAKILALTCSEPPRQVTHWTGRAMAKAVGVSLRSVQRIWDERVGNNGFAMILNSGHKVTKHMSIA